MAQKILDIGGRDEVVRLFGPLDTHLKRLRKAFEVTVTARAGRLRLEGPDEGVRRCEAVLTAMGRQVSGGRAVTEEMVEELITIERSGMGPADLREGDMLELWPGVRPRTPGQQAYVKAMFESDMVFCIGPAGTGKTYLGAAVALSFLKQGRVNRLVLCRPAVEAGESLGFLPGDIHAKVNPYLRPLYDALHDLMDVHRVKRYIDNDIIEILPLAFVRGRTLDNAFIILDEAQNCTVKQMKTFLTRLGPHARLLVTGDITQHDLPPEERSGLADAFERLSRVPDIQFVRLTGRDIVRHPLVRRILAAYERELRADAEREEPQDAS